MKYKCLNKDCCSCHPLGHEWEGEQSSKYYVKCPMCKRDNKVSDMNPTIGNTHTEELV